MRTIRWLHRASEYALGLTMVLAHLALGGRGVVMIESLEEEQTRLRKITPRAELWN